MSEVGHPVSVAEIADLDHDEEAMLPTAWWADGGDDRVRCIGKNWDVVSRVLQRGENQDPPIGAWAIGGGIPFGMDMGFGQPILRDLETTVLVAEDLRAITRDVFLSWYETTDFTDAYHYGAQTREITLPLEQWDDPVAEGLTLREISERFGVSYDSAPEYADSYEVVRGVYLAAAEAGEGVVSWLA